MALPREKREDPVRGYKLASIGTDGRFIPITMKTTTYCADDYAQCSCSRRDRLGHRWEPADSGDVIADCGFYAMKDMSAFANVVDEHEVVLEVDLFGEVLDCDDGYRAMRQRVLRVSARQRCVNCGKQADGFGTDLSDGNYVYVPFCSQCATPLLSLADMKGRIGTEIAWQPQPLTKAKHSVRYWFAVYLVTLFAIFVVQQALLFHTFSWVILGLFVPLNVLNGAFFGRKLAKVRTRDHQEQWFV